MSIEAMKLALAALGLVDDDIEWQERSITRKVVLKAITALRTAIAEAEKQEPAKKPKPVAWLGFSPRSGSPELAYDMPAPSVMRDFNMRPLVYADTPPQRQPEHEGCACRWDNNDQRIATCERHQGWLDVVAEWADRARAAEDALKKQPPQRQPLTEEQIDAVLDAAKVPEYVGSEVIDKQIARAIEAAHGIGGKA